MFSFAHHHLSLCRCSLELLSQPNQLMKLLLFLSELSVIVYLLVMFVLPWSYPPARHLCLPSLHHCSLELLLPKKSTLGASTSSLWIVSHHVIISFLFCSMFSSTLPCSPSTLLSLLLSGVTVVVKPTRFRQGHLCLSL